ncbi:hypothetical protein IRJ41_003083 [Triplophysa rosa]|uniref:Uncharacterized protein n=1 Tax=Triplophysa rosa TaxID=992332 RepID=A0A9W7W7X8_TRIRA|nr:hypothetical protein IRJ41_003083 [Triplophysa rosa]
MRRQARRLAPLPSVTGLGPTCNIRQGIHTETFFDVQSPTSGLQQQTGWNHQLKLAQSVQDLDPQLVTKVPPAVVGKDADDGLKG